MWRMSEKSIIFIFANRNVGTGEQYYEIKDLGIRRKRSFQGIV